MYEQIPSDAPVVQKYGGTSVGTPERIKAIAARVACLWRQGHQRLAIVVSAQAGETNRLIDLVNGVNRRASGKVYDMALAAGEQVSVALMAAALEAEGQHAAPFLAYQLGVVTDGLHAKARIQTIRTEKIRNAWNQGMVPVIAGFQGITPTMDLTTLGRGGSDTSAVALAVALKAGFCEINTDVDGVYSADPRIVTNAQLIENLDYEVALEMASLGSKVLHPRCVELGAKFGMPIVVRHSFKADKHIRTRIMPHTDQDCLEALVVSGVTLDRDVAKLTVLGLPKDSAVISQIFQKMGELGINVDIIIHNKPGDESALRLGFTIPASELENAKAGLEDLARAKEYNHLRLEAEAGLAKVSAVGVGMRSYSGVAARAFKALTEQGVDIHMISTSEIKISCVVDVRDAETATRALHEEFVTTK